MTGNNCNNLIIHLEFFFFQNKPMWKRIFLDFQGV